MRPAEFSNDQILLAGKELVDVGRNITGFALRQKLGGGTPSRLKQVWDEHLAGETVAKTEAVAELPVELAEEIALVTRALTERLSAFAVQVNDKAIRAADRRVNEVVRTAGDQRAQAERELADAGQTVDELETKLDNAAERIASSERRVVELQAMNQSQALELARMSATLEAERTSRNVEVEKLRADLIELGQARNEVSAAREEAAQLRGQIVALQKQAAEMLMVLSSRQNS